MLVLVQVDELFIKNKGSICCSLVFRWHYGPHHWSDTGKAQFTIFLIRQAFSDETKIREPFLRGDLSE